MNICKYIQKPLIFSIVLNGGEIKALIKNELSSRHKMQLEIFDSQVLFWQNITGKSISVKIYFNNKPRYYKLT